MRARFVVVALLVARTASAQAPGEVQPIAAPPQVVVCADCVAVMEHRWSVGLSLAATGLQSKDNTDQANLGGAEVDVAFRVTPHLELQLQLADAKQNHDDTTIDSHMELGSVAIGFRYRFVPFQHLNFYAHTAIGGATLTQDAQPKSDGRAMFQLGFGGEYRFDHLAIHLELRALAIAALMTVPLSDPAGDGSIRLAGQLSGGQALLGASYYF